MSIAEEMEVKLLNIKSVFADPSFNCRGDIKPIDVVDLAKSIEQNGLQNPVLVRPYNKDGYAWHLISGHRRFMAFIVLKKTEIPCIIKYNITDVQARILNFEENLKRKDLNILQEAKALEQLKNAGMVQEEVAEKLGMSRSWVQVRYNLLDMPKEIQNEAAAGLLNQIQLRAIYSLPLAKQYEEVRKIKERRLRGEKNISVKRNVSTQSKRMHNKHEINLMLDHIMDNLGASFATRCLAWAAGNISSLDLFIDIRNEANKRGQHYAIPNEELS